MNNNCESGGGMSFCPPPPFPQGRARYYDLFPGSTSGSACQGGVGSNIPNSCDLAVYQPMISDESKPLTACMVLYG